MITDHGADAVRLFLIATSQVWVPRRFDEQAIRDTSERFLHTLRNTYDGIFATYANFGWSPSSTDPVPADRPPLDRWILSRLARVEQQVDDLLERYEPTLAVRAVMQFVDEDVSRWYVRLSRARFYNVEPADSRAAFATLHEVLTVTARLLAPFAPFTSDWLHRQLVGTSVHLAALFVKGASAARIIAGIGHGRHPAPGRVGPIGARGGWDQDPPATAPTGVCRATGGRYGARGGASRELAPLLRTELNVKEIELQASGDSLVTLTAKANFRTLGKKFGKRMPQAAQAVVRIDKR